jgi:hypothetical protein
MKLDTFLYKILKIVENFFFGEHELGVETDSFPLQNLKKKTGNFSIKIRGEKLLF